MIRGRLVGGHGFSRATTPQFDSGPAGRYTVAANPHFSPHTVILTALASSRSEEATQSKDPYGATNQNTAEGNSDKHVARRCNKLLSASACHPEAAESAAKAADSERRISALQRP